MPLLNPAFCYKSRTVIRPIGGKTPPHNWIELLAQAIKQEPIQQGIISDYYSRRVRDQGYDQRAQLERDLKDIYLHFFHTPGVDKIVIKHLPQEREDLNCTQGFHERLKFVLKLILFPKTLDDLVALYREDIVIGVASKVTDVHANSKYSSVANLMGYGISSTYSGAHVTEGYEAISIKLKKAFDEQYTLFNILKDLKARLRGKADDFGYKGFWEEGYPVGVYDSLLVFFKQFCPGIHEREQCFIINDDSLVQDVNWQAISLYLMVELLQKNYFSLSHHEFLPITILTSTRRHPLSGRETTAIKTIVRTPSSEDAVSYLVNAIKHFYLAGLCGYLDFLEYFHTTSEQQTAILNTLSHYQLCVLIKNTNELIKITQPLSDEAFGAIITKLGSNILAKLIYDAKGMGKKQFYSKLTFLRREFLKSIIKPEDILAQLKIVHWSDIEELLQESDIASFYNFIWQIGANKLFYLFKDTSISSTIKTWPKEKQQIIITYLCSSKIAEMKEIIHRSDDLITILKEASDSDFLMLLKHIPLKFFSTSYIDIKHIVTYFGADRGALLWNLYFPNTIRDGANIIALDSSSISESIRTHSSFLIKDHENFIAIINDFPAELCRNILFGLGEKIYPIIMYHVTQVFSEISLEKQRLLIGHLCLNMPKCSNLIQNKAIFLAFATTVYVSSFPNILLSLGATKLSSFLHYRELKKTTVELGPVKGSALWTVFFSSAYGYSTVPGMTSVLTWTHPKAVYHNLINCFANLSAALQDFSEDQCRMLIHTLGEDHVLSLIGSRDPEVIECIKTQSIERSKLHILVDNPKILLKLLGQINTADEMLVFLFQLDDRHKFFTADKITPRTKELLQSLGVTVFHPSGLPTSIAAPIAPRALPVTHFGVSAHSFAAYHPTPPSSLRTAGSYRR